jgi:hypothetical protein
MKQDAQAGLALRKWEEYLVERAQKRRLSPQSSNLKPKQSALLRHALEN